MKFRPMVFAVAGVLGWAGVAQAQPDPAAPPAAPPADAPAAAPAAAPPPADQPAPPAADQPAPPAAAPPPAPPPVDAPPSSPPPPPVLTFGNGNPPPIDAVEQPVETWKKPNPWTYSWLTWNQSASAGLLGVGRQNQISGDYLAYSWDITLAPRYAFVNTPKDQVYVNASVGIQVELTNSDTTTYEHEWLWKDSQVTFGWAHVAYESKDGEWKTTPAVSVSALLPTSKASSAEGKYFQSGLGLSDRSIVKLKGTKSDWFPNALVVAGASYQHLFARSYDPTLANTVRVRQDAYGGNIDSDQLNMTSFNQDQLKFTFIYYLTIWKDLSFGNAWGLTVPFKHQFTPTSCDTFVQNEGCVSVPNGGHGTGAAAALGPTLGVPITNFDVSLSYDFLGLGRLDVGYNNETPELGYGGQRTNVFYNVETAQFYVDVVAYLDGIYDKTAEKLRKNKGAAQQLPHRGVNY